MTHRERAHVYLRAAHAGQDWPRWEEETLVFHFMSVEREARSALAPPCRAEGCQRWSEEGAG